MKSRECLRKEISELKKEESQHYPHEELVELNKVVSIIDQMDEPEITEEQAYAKITETLPMSEVELKDHVHQLVAYGGHATYGGGASDNQVIINKPEIPQFAADWIEECKGWNDYEQEYDEDNAIGLFSAMDLDGASMSDEVHDYLVGNTETLITAWLYDYTIKEELKYYALIKGYDNPKLETTPWNDKIKWERTTEGKLSVTLGTPLKYTALTIDEWNELGINDTNADFERVDFHDE